MEYSIEHMRTKPMSRDDGQEDARDDKYCDCKWFPHSCYVFKIVMLYSYDLKRDIYTLNLSLCCLL